MSSRFHQAAADGNLELLKEGTRKDLNASDTDGMTPTMLVAYHGNVEALEIICRRGGDPNKCDIWGNTPLHHAASNGRTRCVSFLISFGANIFALDNDMRSPLDAAAIRKQDECVQILDKAATEQTLKHPKRVARLKAQAQRDMERQIQLCGKRQDKHQLEMTRHFDKGSVHSAGPMASKAKVSRFFTSGSLGNTPKQLKDTLKLKAKKKDDHFRNGEAGSSRARKEGLTGQMAALDLSHEEEVEGFVCGFRGKTSIFEEQDELGQKSIFSRPGLGNLVFRRPNLDATFPEKADSSFKIPEELFQFDQAGTVGNSDSENDSEDPWLEEEMAWGDDTEAATPLEVFLASQKLSECLPILLRENMDLETLLLCSDEDLQSIQIQLGPRKKILQAVSRRKEALERPGRAGDTQL